MLYINLCLKISDSEIAEKNKAAMNPPANPFPKTCRVMFNINQFLKKSNLYLSDVTIHNGIFYSFESDWKIFETEKT